MTLILNPKRRTTFSILNQANMPSVSPKREDWSSTTLGSQQVKVDGNLQKPSFKRSTSLPPKLSQAALTTKKLFWFRPKGDSRGGLGHEEETRQNNESRESFRIGRKSPLSLASRNELQVLRPVKELDSFPDDVSGNTEEDFDDDLVGLNFIE